MYFFVVTFLLNEQAKYVLHLGVNDCICRRIEAFFLRFICQVRSLHYILCHGPKTLLASQELGEQ